MDKSVKEMNISLEWDNLSISNDFIFGKVMQNSELCKELLNEIANPPAMLGRIE